MDTLFDVLCRQMGADIDRRGWAHATCPACGKESRRGQSHFSFNDSYGHCFVCGYSVGLRALAERLQVGGELVVRPRPAAPPPEPRHWQTDRRVLARYTGAMDVLPRWQAYKPLTIETIARARLGVGVLPSSRCPHRRLILPVFSRGELIALHGRAYLAEDTDAKWLTAGGSRKDSLYGVEGLRAGATVIICENLVDSLLVAQSMPGAVGVAGGGIGWRPEWIAQIAASRPALVLVWLDNDLVGCPNTATLRALRTAWAAEHPGAPTPEPHGPQIANDLLAAGVRAQVWQWPAGSPPKADLAWYLTRGQ